MIKLIHCPFCGGEPQLDYHELLFSSIPADFFVKCTKCGIHTKDYADQKNAIEVWNRRVQS